MIRSEWKNETEDEFYARLRRERERSNAKLANLQGRPALVASYEVEQFESSLPVRWRDQLERQKQIEHQRVAAYLERMPCRASRIAMNLTVDDPVIALIHGWCRIDERGDGDSALVLSGPPGTGKTVAACWYAWEKISDVPHFVRAADIANSSLFDRDAAWRDVDALIIDDLGAEHCNDKFLAQLDELVDRHYADENDLVITTNLAPKPFARRYGARVMDRLRECAMWISIPGPSRRKAQP